MMIRFKNFTNKIRTKKFFPSVFIPVPFKLGTGRVLNSLQGYVFAKRYVASLFENGIACSKFLLTFLLAFLLTLGAVGAQTTPSLDTFSNPFQLVNPNTSMVYAPVKLDGQILFLVSAEASSGQGMAQGSMTPIETRAQAIEKALYKTIARGFDAENLKISNKVENKFADILISDGKEYNNFSLMVYSEMDARISGYALQEASGYVAHIIYKALLHAQIQRQPAYLWQQGLVSAGILLVVICTSLCLRFFQTRLMLRWRSLKASKNDQMQKLIAERNVCDPEDEDDDIDNSAAVNEIMSQQMAFSRTLNRYDLYRHLLQLGHVLVWLTGIGWIVGLFPYTRWLQIFVIQQPILLGVFLGTNLAIKYSEVLIDRLLAKWANRESLTLEATQRWSLRVSSFAPILKVVVAVVLVGLALLYVLYSFGIPLSPVLTGAGILGFAISLGAQTLIKDLISGALILIEDQYAIGDFVCLNEHFGKVEKMNLRITSIRNRLGTVIITPNSNIRVVQNLSKDWARTKLLVYIDYNTDIDHATSVLQQVIDQLKADESWGGQIIEAEVRGIEDINVGGFTIAIRFETKPGVYRKLVKEYRRRMKLAFDLADIKLGSPVTTIRSKS
jgi:moderate conductance mechanosensitive channel